MKKVLIIDERFPSTGGSRTEKFVKYLPQFGWEPIVLTIDQIGRNPFAEELLNNYSGPRPKIYGTKTLPNFSILKKFNLQRIGGYLNSFFFVPDVTVAWLPYAIEEGLKIIHRESPQIIYSTSPSEGVHLVARFLKKKSGLPWVADFRDLWTLYEKRYNPPTSFHHLVNTYIEKSIYLRWSDFIIANTPHNKAMLCKHFSVDSSKLEVITNGFDPDDALKPEQRNEIKEKMTLGYFGGLEKHAICYQEFLAGFERALRLEKGISLNLWSAISDQLKSDFQENGLNRHITLKPCVSHQQGMKELGGADVLVVLLANGYPHVVPQKLYNYLALNKPILAIVPPNGYAASIVQETNSGVVVSPDDISGIADSLTELHEQWRSGSFGIKVNDAAVRKYRRDELTRKLSVVFDNIQSG
ncbi:MAG: glycosyltransferase [Pseudomonadota bacterium]